MAKSKKKNKGAGGAKKKGKGAKLKSFRPADNANLTPVGPKVDNPFEIRMHRTKHDNLGRRGRHERGEPGVSRGKAIEKRRETLLKEYKVRNKSNVLVDKRIGEKIKNMSEEEKIIRRSVMEKRRQYKQKSIFNLPSTDDILTHKGQVLMDIDRYEDPRDETDSEDERLNEEFVSDAHFSGGFLKVKSKSEDDEANLDDDQKSRKDIIAELILNSKQRKMEKAKEADETYELVSKLDQEFKLPDFRNLLTFVGKEKGETKQPDPPKKEDYDKIVRELHFETKTGQASNRLKTENEIQDDELKQLQKLEKQRLQRMRAQDPSIPAHRSADELADGFELDNAQIPVLSYQEDGRINKRSASDDEQSEASTEEEAEAESESEEDSDSDAFSDLLTDDEDSSDKTKSKSTKTMEGDSLAADDNIDTKYDDIPYVLNLPKSYDSFKKLMSKYHASVKDGDRNVSRFKVVTERLVKYSLLADKSRLPNLFVNLLQLVIEGTESCKSFSENIQKFIEISSVQLHTILLSNPQKCVELMETDINLKSIYSSWKKGSNKLTLGKIALYQMFSKIFCVTDFCHRVLSPLKVDMLDTINSYSINTYMGLLKVLSVVDVLYELYKESKRYCPEIYKLLIDIMEGVSLPPSKLMFKRRRFEFLRISPENTDSVSWEGHPEPPLSDSDDGTPTEAHVLSLLIRVFDSMNNLIQSQYRTRPFNNLIYKAMIAEEKVLRLNWTNKSFHETLFSKKLSESLVLSQEGAKEDDVPAMLMDRPKMLKLYEPMVEENFDGNRKRKMKRKGQTQEEARLSYKVKKEMKSAAREILKDNAFLAKQQMKEQAFKDAERNRKVKELLGSLSNQEGDYRRLKRGKD